MRQPLRIVGMFALALLVPAAASAAQQAEPRCFAETGQCINGRIRSFWEQNGGLAVFGFPVGPQSEQPIEGQPVQAQWFQRARLELHPQNAAPYDVLLGRLGVERLAQQGRDWQSAPRGEPQADCLFFAETGQAVCGGILAAWRANGLELDGQPGTSEAESLALFGLPLTAAQPEQLSDGQLYTVQWFERARLELHPENAAPYDVLLGLLGNEALSQPAPTPTPSATSTPSATATSIPTPRRERPRRPRPTATALPTVRPTPTLPRYP